MNPYQPFVSAVARLVAEGKSLPLGGIAPHSHPASAPTSPVALIFSPHPDDECIIGGFALRLLREAGIRIINVAVTQGHIKSRQQPRWEELKEACDWLGFGREQTAPNGLEKIDPRTRADDPSHWAESVRIIA
jgi:N-acetylglucosamine malate deacetylase 1